MTSSVIVVRLNVVIIAFINDFAFDGKFSNTIDDVSFVINNGLRSGTDVLVDVSTDLVDKV